MVKSVNATRFCLIQTDNKLGRNLSRLIEPARGFTCALCKRRRLKKDSLRRSFPQPVFSAGTGRAYCGLHRLPSRSGHWLERVRNLPTKTY